MARSSSNKYTAPLPVDSEKYKYPMEYNANGQLVPVYEFGDLEDLINQTQSRIADAPEYTYGANYTMYGRPLALSGPAAYRETYRSSEESTAKLVEQSAMHMNALAHEQKYVGLESSVMFKPVYKALGYLDRDVADADIPDIMTDFIDKGVIDMTNTNNPYLIVAAGFQNTAAVRDYRRSMAIRELYGRDLTEEELDACLQAGLDNSAIMAVRNEVMNGKDFDKAFGLMERMTWANWSRYNRRFFDPKNIMSMGVEIATDPLTFVPYGMAFKAPGFLAGRLGSGVAKRAMSATAPRAIANRGLRDFGIGAAIGASQGFTYSSIRNWQGITEDTFSLTMSAMAFSGGISFIGGRLSPGGILRDDMNARISTKNMDDHIRVFSDTVSDAEVYAMARETHNSGTKTLDVFNLSEAEKQSLVDIQGLQAKYDELKSLDIIYKLEGLSDDAEIKRVRAEMADVKKQIDAVDQAQINKNIEEQLVNGETLERAGTIEELRSSIPERDTGLKLATDEELGTFQKFFRKAVSKLPNMTFAGTVGLDTRPNVINYASKLIPNESGWVTKNPETGKLVMATRLGKNLKDVNDHVQNQVNHLLREYEDNVKRYISATGRNQSEVQAELAQYLLTPNEAMPRLNGEMHKVIKPIRELTEILGDMYEDQTKVWGDGFITVTNELGEEQLQKVSPLVSGLSHDKSHFMPAVVDEVKHNDTVKKVAETIQGYGNEDIAIHNAAIQRAADVVIDQVDDNLQKGVLSNNALWEKFKADKARWDDIQRSQNPNYKSSVDKALEKLGKKDEAIASVNESITKLKSDIAKAQDANRSTKTLNNKLVKANTRLEKLTTERQALGAGNERLGSTATEQITNAVREAELREEARSIAVGMVNQHFETTHAGAGKAGFNRPDHTQHRGSYWDYYYKGRPESASIGDFLDTRLDHVFSNYTNQSAARLAGNEVFGAKNYGELMDSHGKWVADNFQYERIGDLSRRDQQLLKSMDGLIRGNYGISVKARDTLGGSVMNAGPIEGMLETFKNFTGMTKNGFFWFYNMFETAAGVQAYGADFVVKGTPILRNKFMDSIKGVKPTEKDLRFMANRLFSDELMSTNSWNNIIENSYGKYGQNSTWGKIVAGSEWLYKKSPLTKLQSASQMAPEHLALNELMAEVTRFAHTEGKQLTKKQFGKGFLNEADMRRMGITSDRFDDLIDGIRKVTYLDDEGFPRVRTDVYDSFLTPRNKSTLSIMSNYVRDEIIQRGSYIDGFLYKSSNASSFWDIMTQFKSFGMNSARKKLIKAANRSIYEGAHGEVGLQFMLNWGLGTAMSQLKTMLRYNSLANDEAKERFMELNYGVKSVDDIDWGSPDVWMRTAYNGLQDSSWFAGIQMAASYFDSRAMMNRTSGGNLTNALQTKPGQSPQLKKFSNVITQNIPMLGKADELVGSANILLKYVWSPSSLQNVEKTRQDSRAFLKTFLPNEPFIISPALNALSGKYD